MAEAGLHGVERMGSKNRLPPEMHRAMFLKQIDSHARSGFQALDGHGCSQGLPCSRAVRLLAQDKGQNGWQSLFGMAWFNGIQEMSQIGLQGEFAVALDALSASPFYDFCNMCSMSPSWIFFTLTFMWSLIVGTVFGKASFFFILNFILVD